MQSVGTDRTVYVLARLQSWEPWLESCFQKSAGSLMDDFHFDMIHQRESKHGHDNRPTTLDTSTVPVCDL